MTAASAVESSHAGWIDTVAAVLLALAAVATAWSSYQASRWTGEQAKAFGAANAARVEATQKAGLANAEKQVDIALFTQWVDARLHGEHEIAAFYEHRFRDEFEAAFQAWLHTDPFTDPTAPESPFSMPEYAVAAQEEAAALNATADAGADSAHTYVQWATNYVLGVVLFAVALFFAGIAPRLARPRLRVGVLITGVIVFLGALVWIATSPVSLSI